MVAVHRVSLCGSDYGLFNGSYGGPSVYPVRFGHEWSGEVVEKGSDVKVKIGDRVTGDCSKWCGKCPVCHEDKNLCQHIQKYGITEDGFSQQFVVVPEKYIYVGSHSLPYEVLALTEIFSVALHAIHRFSLKPTEPPSGPTLIIGGGALGMAIYMLLKYLYHWKNLEVYDVSPEKISYLQDRFSQEKITNSLGSLSSFDHSSYKSLYESARYPLIFEAAGKPGALQKALESAKQRGTIVSLGMVPAASLDTAPIVLKSLTVIGSIGGTGEFPEILDFFSKHVHLVQPFITASYPYQETERAFLETQDRKKNVKVQIDFSN